MKYFLSKLKISVFKRGKALSDYTSRTGSAVKDNLSKANKKISPTIETTAYHSSKIIGKLWHNLKEYVYSWDTRHSSSSSFKFE